MRAHVRSDQQIAGRPAAGAWLALAGQADHHAVIHTGRDLRLNRTRNKLVSLTRARGTRRFDELSAPLTSATGSECDCPNPLAGLDALLLTAAVAVRALDRFGSGFGPGSLTRPAFLGSSELDKTFAAFFRFLQGKFQRKM